jgi:[acyl-carrier-protein] S-malonyltransferase
MSKHAYLFPGQGSQFVGMGKSLYNNNEAAKKLFAEANEILGFDICSIMFDGTDEQLKQTNVTQPAVFLHSTIAYLTLENPLPNMVAGHSLGEFSALVANKTLDFKDALKLVSIRAMAMQKACELQPSTMAAIINLSDEKVEEICLSIAQLHNEVVVAANYNCPGQLVISGTINGINLACEAMKLAGAKRALVLPVGGAFHSPLMLPAKQELAAAIETTHFNKPICPVYQNVVACAVTNEIDIKQNLIAQLTGAVKWTKIIENMHQDGATKFTEVGPGKVLQGLALKIVKDVEVFGVN